MRKGLSVVTTLVCGLQLQVGTGKSPGLLGIIKGIQEPTVRPWSEAVSSGHRAEEAQAVPGVKVCGSPSPSSCPHSCLLSLTRAIMPPRRSQRIQRLQAQTEAQGLVGTQAPGGQEEGAAASSSTVTPGTLEEVAAATLSPQGACSSPTGLASNPEHHSNEGSITGEQEGLSTSQHPAVPASLPQEELNDKMSDLVHFLLLKYRMKEPTTQEEMLNIVIRDYQDFFPEIFEKASDCMHMIFGLDVKEVDPASHCYALVTALGLTYSEELNDTQRFPKVGLLIITLGVIHLQGDRAREEVLWEALGIMGVHAGSEHYIYGEPRKLITQDWVQEGYLEYRQVPNSDPACYEFLWGPRAHAETTKTKVLEYVARFNRTDPRSFALLYEETLRDEVERE
ncbi:melanoma-associated antigen 8-like [Eulemur rufifrons]|uniref:melanoma-associated antigen 8-like n=1 Tax=Eulemur rufifrons TaxID=859984 RepID=UPI003743D4C2